jgi:hypothetical protein
VQIPKTSDASPKTYVACLTFNAQLLCPLSLDKRVDAMFHAHPAIAESVKEAALDVNKSAIQA